MISTTDAQKNAFLSDSSNIDIKVFFPQYKNGYTITNANIEKESLRIKRSIMNGKDLDVVGCISTYCSITVHDVDRSDDLLHQLMYIDVNPDNTGWVRLFNGNVSAVTKGSNRTIHKIEAYDALHDAMNVDVTSFYNDHLACTLKELLFDVLPPWSYNQDMVLPNGNMLVPCGTIHKVEKLSKTDLIKSICQIAGCFGYITGDNKFNIYVPSQQDDHNTVRIPSYKNLDYETYETAEITDVVIKESDSDEGMSIGQDGALDMIWESVPDSKEFTSEDAYKAYYASNLVPYSALTSASDKYTSLALKDRYVANVTKEETSGYNVTFATKNSDSNAWAWRFTSTDGWIVLVGSESNCTPVMITSYKDTYETYTRHKSGANFVSINPPYSYPSTATENKYVQTEFTGADGKTYYCNNQFVSGQLLDNPDNIPIIASLSEFAPSQKYTVEYVGISWDWTIRSAIKQVIKATGMTIDYVTPELRKLISDAEKALATKGWMSRVGGVVVMPSKDWIANRQFIDDCMQIMFGLGLYQTDGIRGTEKQSGATAPTKSTDTTSSLYGNNWNSYVYHSYPSKMKGISKLTNYDTVTSAGASKADFFQYFRTWVSSVITNSTYREAFLAKWDKFVSEKGAEMPEGLIQGNYQNDLRCVSLSFVPTQYLAQGITFNPSSTTSSMMIWSSKTFNYVYVDVSSLNDVNYTAENRSAEYSTTYSGYVGTNQSISRAIHVDNYNTEVTKYDMSLLKIGKGETQSEVWAGDIGSDDGNKYIVLGNIFWFDQSQRQTMLYNLYNEIVYLANLSYRPFTASNPYMPWVECGDRLIYEDAIDGDMEFRCLTQSISGIQSMFTNPSAEGKQYQSVFKSSLGVKLVDDTKSIAEDAEEKASSAQASIVVIERDYATKTWTAEEIASAVSAINQFNISVVDTLPTTGQAGTLYFVRKSDPETGDTFDEYMWLNNAWEKVGSTNVDLTDYAKKSELPTKVSQLQNDSGYLSDVDTFFKIVDGELCCITEA